MVDARPDPAPVLGEPLAVEFANTLYPHRKVLQDALRDRASAARWLLDRADEFRPALEAADANALDEVDLGRLVALRDAVRAALYSSAAGEDVPAAARAAINTASALSPRWPVLDCRAAIEIVCATGTDPLREAEASIAQSAVHVLGGPMRDHVEICPGDGCSMLFVKDHPRRTWCTRACGNRNRVARHQARHQAPAGPTV
ncbi:CGNR zinc finger domain-containing protein [Streptomyces sp. NPDC020983]|uniref:CGNR zinc finger domain-containing protein n=1 Tax=Streptomyces sp. NPDC020983 TaxID=3365106 RepID=UPI00379CE8CC